MDGLGPIDIQILLDNPALLRSLMQGEQAFQGANSRMSQQAKESGSNLDNWAKRAAIAATSYFSVTAAQNFVSQLISVRGQFEQITVAYEVMLRSKEAGDKLFAQTIDFAATTPFGLTDVATATKQLLAYGFTADEVKSTLTMLGNIASGVSAPLGEIVYLYGTLRTQGRAYTKDIMQFTGRGIDVVGELATQFKRAKEDVSGLVESGKVGFPEVQKAFEAMTGSGGIFYNLMSKQSQTLTGQLSNLGDEFEKMLNDIGQANQDVLKGGVAAVSDLIKNYETVLDIIQALVIMYGIYRAAVMVSAVALRIQQEAALQAALANQALAASNAEVAASNVVLEGSYALLRQGVFSAGNAMSRFLTITGLSNPYIALAVAIGAMAASFATMREQVDYATHAGAQFNEEMGREQDKLGRLFGALKATTAGTQQRKDAVEALKSSYGDYLPKLDLEKASLKQIEDAYQKVNLKISENIGLKIKQEQADKLSEDFTKQRGEYVGKILEDIGKNVGEEQVGYANNKLNELIQQALAGKIRLGFGARTSDGGQMQADLKNARQYVKLLTGGDGEQAGWVGDYLNSLQAVIDKQIEAQNKLNDFNKGTARAMPKPKVEPLETIYDAAYYDKIIKEATEGMRGLDKTAKDFKEKRDAFRKIIADAQKERAEFDTKGDVKGAKKASDDRQRFLKELDDKELEVRIKGMAQNETELSRIAAYYQKKRDEAEKLGLGQGVVTRLNNAEKAETGVVRAEQDNEVLKKSIEDKKKLYADYEAFRQQAGSETADKQYSELLKSGADFKSYLNDILTALPTTGLTGAQTALKKVVTDNLAEVGSNQATAYQNLLKDAMTYEQTRNAMTEKYLTDRAAMVAAGDYDSLEGFDQFYQRNLDQLKDSHVQSLDAFKALFNGIDDLSSDAAKAVIANAAAMLDSLVATGDISKEMADQIKRALKEATKKIDSKLPDQLRGLASGFSRIASEVSVFDEALAKVLNTIGNVAGGVADIKSGMDVINSKDANFMTKAGAGLGMFGAAVGIFQSIGGLFNNSAATNRQNEYNNELQIKSIEAVNKKLERQLALTKEIYGIGRLEAFKKDLADIEKAQEEAAAKLANKYQLTGDADKDRVIAKYNQGAKMDVIEWAEFKKMRDKLTQLNPNTPLEELLNLDENGKLDEQTKAIVASLKELEQKAKETKAALFEDVTGMVYGSLNSELRQLAESNELTAGNIEKVLQKAINAGISKGFETRFIQTAMEPFYDALYEAGLDGNYTSVEIEALKKQKEQIAKYLEQQGKALGDIIGNDDPTEDSAMQSQIKGITQEQAGVIEGVFRGVQLEVMKQTTHIMAGGKTMQDQLTEMRQQTLELIEIRINTKETADNTKHLKPIKDSLASIEKKMSNNQNQIEAGGFRG